jgi:nucleoside-diphosphate-sugar epimerase
LPPPSRPASGASCTPTSLEATHSGARAGEELGFVPRVDLDEGMQAVRQWALRERLL